MSEETAKQDLVPVTVVTGALGSGKTTFLKHVLQSEKSSRIAIVENEFGEEIGIESLVAKTDPLEEDDDGFKDFYELSNGCICCSVRDDLVSTLENMLRYKKKFDRIVVETTGLADPGPVASLFWVDTDLGSELYLDGIITVIDSYNFSKWMSNDMGEQRECFFQQIAYADVILLNKSDRVDEKDLAKVCQEVTDINSQATAIDTVKGEVELSKIFGLRTLEARTAEKSLATLEHEQGDHSHNHVADIQSICIRLDTGPLVYDKLMPWIGELLWETDELDAAEKIFRVKGVLWVEEKKVEGREDKSNGTTKWVLQGVHDTFECWDSGERFHPARPSSAIIFIGKSLNKGKLKEGFHKCTAS
eukprot:gb/GECG01013105.1/.p1 GENE.gb/GECG01013105.1/~~gb/GECG01013105.1/.p1  ORF type:complete len:361 (+),score=56.43 gb/GECG01013105.1/:1-1083(+)